MVIDNDETEDDSTVVQGGPAPNVAIGGENKGNLVIGNHNTTIIVRSKPEQERADRNRRAMLEVVQNTWVEGVLEKSLYHETLIDLGLEERPDAVTRPWDVQVQMPDRPRRVLPPGTPIVDVFDEAQGELLILGAPGAGKTTMLLELARDAIARARDDVSLPIPVVFNLSSWIDPKQPLAAWLVDELVNKYHAPKKVAQGWVEQDELLLLLDGLDEVRVENREACAQAINIFRQAHGLSMPLVVCSRIADYEALNTRLQLRGAVLLQPLTDEQVDDYFERAGSELTSVRQAWQQDAELQELARQPLMLSIMTLAYRGAASEVLVGEQVGSIEARRNHLFDAYIQQMFVRVGRAKDERYTSKETIHYLAWLAHKLVEQGQSVFLLENMRRSWLPGTHQGLHQIIIGLVVGLLFGLAGGMVGKLVLGLAFGLMIGLLVTERESPVEVLKWSRRQALGELVDWLVFGLVFGLIIGLVGGLGAGQMLGLGGGLVRVLGGGLSGWLLFGLVGGLMFGLVIGLMTGLDEVEVETKTIPNQGIQQAFKNGLFVGLLAELAFGLIFGLAGWRVLGLVDGLVDGLGGVWALGLASWLMFGGSSVINHYILRFLLHHNGHIPRNYEHFLEYAASRLFLRRVGGSYVFVHRLLMEHFAAMWGKI